MESPRGRSHRLHPSRWHGVVTVRIARTYLRGHHGSPQSDPSIGNHWNCRWMQMVNDPGSMTQRQLGVEKACNSRKKKSGSLTWRWFQNWHSDGRNHEPGAATSSTTKRSCSLTTYLPLSNGIGGNRWQPTSIEGAGQFTA